MSKWNKKSAEYQRLYRAGKLKIDPTKSAGRVIGKKRKRNVGSNDFATFVCPECGESLSANLIRLRPEFYECRSCKHVFEKEESFDENDFWLGGNSYKE